VSIHGSVTINNECKGVCRVSSIPMCMYIRSLYCCDLACVGAGGCTGAVSVLVHVDGFGDVRVCELNCIHVGVYVLVSVYIVYEFSGQY